MQLSKFQLQYIALKPIPGPCAFFLPMEGLALEADTHLQYFHDEETSSFLKKKGSQTRWPSQGPGWQMCPSEENLDLVLQVETSGSWELGAGAEEIPLLSLYELLRPQ